MAQKFDFVKWVEYRGIYILFRKNIFCPAEKTKNREIFSYLSAYRRFCSFKLFCCVNAYALLAALVCLELNVSVNESEECIVATDANVGSGVDLCSSLSNEDVTSDNLLAAELLNTETLGLTVTAVLCRTNTFFMSEEL